MRDLSLLQGNEDAETEDALSVLDQLNDMMHEWASDGVDVLHADLALTDEFVFFVPPADADSDTIGALVYRSTWNAGTNSPSLTSSTGTDGNVYKVSAAGSTALNDVTSWALNDYAIFNGDEWLKGISSRRFNGGVAAMLSVRIAPEFGKAIPDAVVMRAATAWANIQAAFIKPPKASFDVALTRMPSRGLWEGI
jgi:hypothetical protein